MTPAGKAWALKRLTDAPDRQALTRAWDDLSVHYQNDPEIKATYGKRMERMK